MDHTPAVPALYGVMAEFEDPTALVDAARRDLRRGLPDSSTRSRRSRFTRSSTRCTCTTSACSLLVLLGGLAGMCTGLGLQVWVSAVAYPLNIGGRPYLSWPMFIPVTFELTILFAAFAAVFGMFG